MKTYAFDFINNTILGYASRKQAVSSGNGRTLASDETELGKANVATGAFVEIYNRHTETKIQRFSDRNTAVKRVWALALAKATEVESSTESDTENMGKISEEDKAAKAAEKVAAKEAEKATKLAAKEAKAAEKANKEPGVRGRESQYKNCTLVRSTGWPADGTIPGRDGSIRHATYVKLNDQLNAGPNGNSVSYGDYDGSIVDMRVAVWQNLIKIVNADGSEVTLKNLPPPKKEKEPKPVKEPKAAKEPKEPKAKKAKKEAATDEAQAA